MEEIDTLEHFTISRRRVGSLWELGRGAMGITYKALDTNLQSEVAVKVISAAPSPTVRPPLRSESATERTVPNRSLSRQPRVFQPVPNQLRQQLRPAQSPIFLTQKNYSQAKREALRQFDAQWNAKRDDLKRQRDWLSYQINHFAGTDQEKFKVQMEQVKGQIDQFDGQRRSARKALRQSWEGLRTGQ